MVSHPAALGEGSHRSAAHRGGAAAPTPHPAYWIALISAFLFATLWGSLSFGIQDNNEGVYAEIGREMATGGGWIIPHLNGLPYIDKPPMLYWAVAGLMKLLGGADLVVRLVPIGFFAGTLGAVYWIGRQAGHARRALMAGVLVSTATGLVVMSRSMLFDVPMTCFVSLAMACVYGWLRTGSRRMIRGFYVLLAAAVMTKGLAPIVIAGGAALFATAFVTRSPRRIGRLFDPLGIALFFLLATPWHILAELKHPGFLRYYFVNEQFLRFLDARVPHDYYTGPFYYYLVRLPLYLGPWVVFIPLLLRKRDESQAFRENSDSRILRTLLWCWLLVPLAFYSISKAKANYYLLSGMPALALLITLSWPRDGVRSRALVGGAIGGAFIGLALLVAPHLRRLGGQEVSAFVDRHPVFFWVWPAGVAVSAVAAVILSMRRRAGASFACMAVVGLLIIAPYPVYMGEFEATLSQRPLAAYLDSQPHGTVVLFRDFEKLSSLVFYEGHPIPILDSVSNELYYASHDGSRSPQFLKDSTFRRMARNGRVWLVVRPGRLEEARERFANLPLMVSARFAGGIILTNEPTERVTAAAPARGRSAIAQ